jgi:glycosyltransferase involved in cell wall biosynthesis
MKVLHTEWSDGLGGQEKRVLAELKGLSARGHQVFLVCREEAGIKAEAGKAGVPVYTLPLKSPYDLTSIFALRRILKRMAIDVVNTHSGIDSWVGGIAAKLAGVPLLVRTRHLNIPLKRTVLNFIHYLPDMYITCGKNMKATLVGECGFPDRKVVSIPTGVDSLFFGVSRDMSLKQEFGIPEASPVVSNIGILRRVKGHETTLNAVKRVVDFCPEVRFLLVGDGPRRVELEKMTDSLGIGRHVIFTGFLSDVTRILSFTDVSVLSSWSEGLPQSVLQAMAAGVPVVATEVGGVPEVVMNGKTGLLVRAGDSEGLAEGIIRLLSDRDDAIRMAANARALVLERHSEEAMLDRIEELYKRCLG